MKTLPIILCIISLCIISSLLGIIYAQGYKTDSNRLIIRIGNPTGPPIANASGCPVKDGKITCGSRDHPERSNPRCGHCGVAYPVWEEQCTDTSYNFATFTAIDVGGPNAGYGAELFMPTLNGQAVEWVYLGWGKDGGNQVIQTYKTTSEGITYKLQLHHSKKESFPIGTRFQSGEVGAHICDTVCVGVNNSHSHVQIAIMESNGNLNWKDASDYFCRSS